MSEEAAKVPVAPIEFELDGCVVSLLEIIRGRQCYLYVQALNCGGVVTRVFPIYACSREEWLARLKADIAKVRLVIKLYGRTVAEKLFGQPLV